MMTHITGPAVGTGPAVEISNFQNPRWRTAAGPPFKRGKEGKKRNRGRKGGLGVGLLTKGKEVGPCEGSDQGRNLTNPALVCTL